MFRFPHRIMRRLGLDAVLEDECEVEPEPSVLLSPASVRARRRLVLGASRAAQAALAERPAADRDEPIGFASQATAETAFRAVTGVEVRVEILFAGFLPTVVLYPDRSPANLASLHWWYDDVPPHEYGKGLVRIVTHGGRRRSSGEVFLLPPALRNEGRRRIDWMRSVDLDPPRVRDNAGPFWTLGESEIWRLDFLGWHELLILAAVIGTRIPVTAVVCELESVPRIGYVVETARELGRTVVHVPLAAVPEELRAALETTRALRRRGRSDFVTADATEPESRAEGEPELWR